MLQSCISKNTAGYGDDQINGYPVASFFEICKIIRWGQGRSGDGDDIGNALRRIRVSDLYKVTSSVLKYSVHF